VADADAIARTSTAGGGPATSRAKGAAGAVLLAAVTLAAYLPAIRAGFIWDDNEYVTQNRTLRSLHGLGRIWAEPTSIPQYYPLVHTMFWAEYHLWGLEPAGYHAVNITLHALAAVLLWRLLRRLGVPGAYLAAAIFALHPVHVESVAWITERKNVLSMVFYLLAFGAYLRFSPLEGGAPRRWGWYAAALVLFIGALLSKTVTASLPAAALLVVWWKRGRIAWRDVWPLIPFFAVGAGMGTLTVLMETCGVGAQGEEWNLTAVERCLVAGRAVWFYAGKLLWPANLIFIYPRWPIDAGAGWPYLYPAALAAVLAALAILRKRIGRAPIAAALFFVGTLAPALGFVNVYPFRYSFVADHFQYHASVGLIALGAGLAAAAARRLGPWGRRAGYAAGGLVLALLGFLTWQQGHIYKDLETLWTDTLAKDPSCWMAYSNLWTHYSSQGDLERGLACYRETLRLNPRDAETRAALGEVLLSQGRLPEALAECREAVRLAPNMAVAHDALGRALAAQDRIAEAIACYREALRLDLGYAWAHYDLASALARQGKTSEAVTQYLEALRLDPDHPDWHNGLGMALAAQGNPDGAVAHFREAIRLAPNRPDAIKHLAWILATHPDPAVRSGTEAVRLAERAVALTGRKDPSCLDTLAAAHAEAGRFPDAAAAAHEAAAMATALGQKELAAQIDARRALYQAGRPYRAAEPPTVAAPRPGGGP